ncbi:MAG: FtsQ-type POTRA domain-containing protein [Candidatus Cloacimonadales bacterium]
MFKASNRRLVRGSRRYFIYFFLSLVLIILTTVGTFEIIKRTDLLKLEKVQVVGNSNELNYRLEKDLGKYYGINLYQLDLVEIPDTLLQSYPIIEDISIKRRVHNRLKVEYTMESPFAIINFADGKNYYINRDLKLLERVNYGYLQKSLPIISAKLKSDKYRIGSVIQDSVTIAMADYLSIVLEEKPDFQDKISDLFVHNDKIYFREIFRGNIVFLGNENIGNKIDLFMSHFSSFASGLFIDLSYKNQIVTRKADF